MFLLLTLWAEYSQYRSYGRSYDDSAIRSSKYNAYEDSEGYSSQKQQRQRQRLEGKGPISDIIAQELDNMSELEMQHILELPQNKKELGMWKRASIREIPGSKEKMIHGTISAIEERLNEQGHNVFKSLQSDIRPVVEKTYHELKTDVLTDFATNLVGKTKQRSTQELKEIKQELGELQKRKKETHSKYLRAENDTLNRQEKLEADTKSLEQQIAKASTEQKIRLERRLHIIQEQKDDLQQELNEFDKTDHGMKQRFEKLEKKRDKTHAFIKHLSEIQEQVVDQIHNREKLNIQRNWQNILNFEKERQVEEQRDTQREEKKKQKYEEAQKAESERDAKKQQAIANAIDSATGKINEGTDAAKESQGFFRFLGPLFGGGG